MRSRSGMGRAMRRSLTTRHRARNCKSGLLFGPSDVSCARGVGRVIAVATLAWRWRKVRAPADEVPGNAWGARAHGQCNRKQTAYVFAVKTVEAGKGEMVR